MVNLTCDEYYGLQFDIAQHVKAMRDAVAELTMLACDGSTVSLIRRDEKELELIRRDLDTLLTILLARQLRAIS